MHNDIYILFFQPCIFLFEVFKVWVSQAVLPNIKVFCCNVAKSCSAVIFRVRQSKKNVLTP